MVEELSTDTQKIYEGIEKFKDKIANPIKIKLA